MSEKEVYEPIDPDLRERAYELRGWALNRIAHCRREEEKFGASGVAIDASTERRALQAVLRILFNQGD